MSGVKSEKERVTVTIPKELLMKLQEFNKGHIVNRSQLFRQAIEEYVASRKNKKLEKIAYSMKREYEKNKELISLTGLDSEDFL